ncbi:MAG TPA: hypothetical protein VKS82_01660 [Streptosporangiaceae bacterium]|nr:hypothetical protein [Streptosporangiaceae bacterium]
MTMQSSLGTKPTCRVIDVLLEPPSLAYHLRSTTRCEPGCPEAGPLPEPVPAGPPTLF